MLMKKLFFLALLLPLVSFGQKLHNLSEIMGIMDKSPIKYEINELKESLRPLDQTNNINDAYAYKLVDTSGVLIKRYTLSDTAKQAFDKAEMLFLNNEYDEALKYYQKTLELAPDFNHVRTYIGQIYYIRKDFKKAIEYYQEAIQNNSIDYMSYWFLADTYLAMGKKKDALDNIIIAKILNRNNPRIHDSFLRILEKNKLEYPDWAFNPQMRIDSLTDNRIRIAANPDWLPYALVEAAWTYDPAYSNLRNGFPLNKAKEGVLSMSVNLTDKKITDKYPELKAMLNALKNNEIEAYIFYEILLVEKPYVAYYINPKGKDNIVKYIKKNRLKKV